MEDLTSSNLYKPRSGFESDRIDQNAHASAITDE